MNQKNEGIYDARGQLGWPKTIVLGFQHMFAMFGATVLVPALTGLSVSATLLFAGLGTLLFRGTMKPRNSGAGCRKRRIRQTPAYSTCPIPSFCPMPASAC